MIRETIRQACEYLLMDGNIHRFVFHECSDGAIDELFDVLESIIRQRTNDDPLLMYIDISGFATKLPSFSYTRTRLKRIASLYPNRPPARAAIVHNYGMVVSSLQTFMKIVPIKSASQYQFISANEPDRARDWLLQIDNSASFD